jgi:glycosyltransferase involved in cell wall biosynthesis
VEALHAGLPVVTTALGGALEIVDDTCGVVVPPGNPNALAEALRRLIQDVNLRTALGTAGRSHARELCDPVAQMGRLKDSLAGVVREEVLA